MPQYDFQMTDFERIFRKRYRLLFSVALLVVAFTVVFGRMKPSLYSASATVKVDQGSVTGLGMAAVMWGDYQSLETQSRVITSYPVLFRAAKRLSRIPDTASSESLAEREKYNSELTALQALVETSVSGNTNIIRIKATSGIPREAKDVANAVAYAYKDFSTYGKSRQADKVKKFIERQLDVAQRELTKAENAVKLFNERQDIPSLDQASQQIIKEATRIRSELDATENAIRIISDQQEKLRRRSASRDFARLKEDAAVSDTGDISPETKMSWVSQFTDQDPGLAQLNARLLKLQFSLRDQLAYYKEEHPASRDIENKIQQTIAQMLAEYKLKTELLQKKRAALLVEKEESDKAVKRLPAEQMEYSRLVRSMKINEDLNVMLSQKYQEALIAEAGVVDDVTIMSLATQPTKAVNKNTPRMALIGAFLGLLLGTLFAVVREMFDTSIGTIEDVERTLKLSVLAVIPHIQLEEQQKRLQRDLNLSKRELSNLDFRARLVTQFDPKKPIAEAYRILRTNIEYLSIEKPIKTIHVTSATMQEGKSTTIANLAVAFAQQGKEVLLLECNLRRPSLYRLFGVEKAPGMADILIDRMDWKECVKTVTDLALGEFSIRGILNTPGLENLNMITYGHTPPNPAEILSSPGMNQLLKEVREHFDIVLVDAPPLLPVADSMVLSTKVDGVVLIYK
ncbi:MAG: polysaccharide biosynthesis tyrosine autokinase, partial [Chitinivibrionales bacterium]|nr:polysaccharide biosynthesis tyrosine autokinase [Chitinivibrionales bacterium]